MNRADWEERLNDYVDGLMAPSEARDFEETALKDPEVREAECRLRSLLSAAKALPREVQPSCDLWGCIESRLSRRCASRSYTTPVPHGSPAPQRHHRWARWAAPALAAAFACVFVAGLIARDMLQGSTPPGLVGSSAAAPALTPAIEQEFAKVDAEYAEARSALLAALAQSDLPETTIETFVANLNIIDDAISETRLALKNNPENGQLMRSLVASYDRKRALIQEATQWPDRDDTETVQ
ncbi:MAG: hypothetical protein AMXMBFR84_25470 [Candidatus Hydrogenedentota bacterium]